MENKEVNYRLRMSFLKDKGFNKKDLQKLTGANELAVTKWSAGAVIPPLETLLLLASTTNTNISYLLMLTDIAAPITFHEIRFRLKETRLMCGLKQSELAENAGVTTKSICSYELSEELIYGRKSIRMLISVADALSVSLDYLLGLTDRKDWESIEDSPFYKIKPGMKFHIKNENYNQECTLSSDGTEIILEEGEILSILDPRLYSVVITIS